MDNFEMAFQVAVSGHRQQVDKSGEPYIKHLMRVAGTVPKYCMAVAILHDYFEDVVKIPLMKSPFEEIQRHVPFLDEEEIYALYLLTRAQGLYYTFYIDRISGGESEIARLVKIADLKDHLERGTHLTPSLSSRYLKALEELDPSDFHE